MPVPFPTLLNLYLLTTVAAIVDDQPYCALRYRRLCQGKGRHVGCQFPEPGPSEYCTNYTKINFTGDLRNFITNYINRRRQRVAAGTEKVRGGVLLPKPGIMMLVAWDRELAFLAQRLADQCNFAHDECRATVRYPYAGQTVGQVRLRRSSESDELTTQKAIRRVFDVWWGERRRVLPSQLTSPFKLVPKGTVWGHFTQLAVWTLRAVGCGAVRHGERYPHLLLVCDFSHTNMLGQRTLPPGPIAPCPPHTARNPRTAYPLLCAVIRRPLSYMESEDGWERLNEGETFENYEDDHKNLYTDNVTRKYGIVVKVSSRRPLIEMHDEVATRPETLFISTTHGISEISDPRFIKNVQKSTIVDLVNHWDSPKELEDIAEQKRRLLHSEYNSRFDNQRARKVLGGRLHSWYLRRPYLEMGQLDEVTTQFGNNHPEDLYSATIKRFTMSPITKITEEVLQNSLFVRHRWKYTKDRPKRPGANALLNNPKSAVKIQMRRPYFASLILDKEDLDQFIRDTGFNPQWRAHN